MTSYVVACTNGGNLAAAVIDRSATGVDAPVLDFNVLDIPLTGVFSCQYRSGYWYVLATRPVYAVNNGFYKSADLRTFQWYESPVPCDDWFYFLQNGEFAAVDSNTIVVTNTNGTYWRSCEAGPGTFNGFEWVSSGYYLWIGGAGGGYVRHRTAIDATAWTGTSQLPRQPGGYAQPRRVLVDGDTVFAPGRDGNAAYSGAIWYSTDGGFTWTEYFFGAQSVYELVHAQLVNRNLWVAGSTFGPVSKWTPGSSTLTQILVDGSGFQGSNGFAAVDSGNLIVYSPHNYPGMPLVQLAKVDLNYSVWLGSPPAGLLSPVYNETIADGPANPLFKSYTAAWPARMGAANMRAVAQTAQGTKIATDAGLNATSQDGSVNGLARRVAVEQSYVQISMSQSNVRVGEYVVLYSVHVAPSPSTGYVMRIVVATQQGIDVAAFQVPLDTSEVESRLFTNGTDRIVVFSRSADSWSFTLSGFTMQGTLLWSKKFQSGIWGSRVDNIAFDTNGDMYFSVISTFNTNHFVRMNASGVVTGSIYQILHTVLTIRAVDSQYIYAAYAGSWGGHGRISSVAVLNKSTLAVVKYRGIRVNETMYSTGFVGDMSGSLLLHNYGFADTLSSTPTNVTITHSTLGDAPTEHVPQLSAFYHDGMDTYFTTSIYWDTGYGAPVISVKIGSPIELYNYESYVPYKLKLNMQALAYEDIPAIQYGWGSGHFAITDVYATTLAGVSSPPSELHVVVTASAGQATVTLTQEQANWIVFSGYSLDDARAFLYVDTPSGLDIGYISTKSLQSTLTLTVYGLFVPTAYTANATIYLLRTPDMPNDEYYSYYFDAHELTHKRGSFFRLLNGASESNERF